MQEDAPKEDNIKDTIELTLLQGFSVSVISATSLLRSDDKIIFNYASSTICHFQTKKKTHLRKGIYRRN